MRMRRVRRVALLALALIWGPFLWVLGEGVVPGQMLVPAVCLILPLLATPLLVLAQPRSGASGRALGHVAGMSATVGVYALLLLVTEALGRPPLWSGRWLWQGSLLLVIATFWALRVTARQAQKAGSPRQADGGCLPALGLAVVCLLTGALFAFFMIGHWARPSANEWSTLALLRTIGKAAAAHGGTGQCGYPETLAALNVDDAELAARMRQGSTFLKNSYTIVYRPGPPRRNAAPGCPPGVESYMVTARPLTWGVDGRSSFLMDEAAAVHYTSRNRAATAEDPVVTR